MTSVHNNVNWTIFSNKERTQAIEDLKTLIEKNEGYIINFNLFSDLAMSLTVEIEERNILGFYKAISNTFKISQTKPDNLKKYTT